MTGFKSPQQWILKKLFIQDITFKDRTLTTDSTWGTAETITWVDTDYKCQANWITTEDELHEPYGDVKVGDLRAFFKMETDFTPESEDRLVFDSITCVIYRVIKWNHHGDIYWEIYARRLIP